MTPWQAAANAPRPHDVRPSRGITLVGVGACVVAITFGLALDPARVWSNLLVDGFLLLALALGGVTFGAIHHLSGAAWSAGMRRVAEALSSVLPYAAVAMLILFFGRGHLYPWAGAVREHGERAAHASWFFSPAMVFGRMTLLLALWTWCAISLRTVSSRQDARDDPALDRAAVRRAAAFAVVFAWTLPIAAGDWFMALTPGWTSTIFFVYVFAGVLVEGLAAVTLVTLLLRDRGLLRDIVTTDQLQDLGKLLLAFATFWAYIWLCQYLLIWYGNLPEEVTYYQTRTRPEWVGWFAANVAVNWLIPFAALLPRAAKRDPRVLKAVAIVLLAGRWLDLYLMVAPETIGRMAGVVELAIAAGYAAIAWQIVSHALTSRPLVVRHEPHLRERFHHQ